MSLALRRTGRAFRTRVGDPRYDDRGSLLIQLIVALAVFSILLAMSAVVISTANRQSVAAYQQITGTEADQLVSTSVDSLIRAAVDPTQAWAAMGGTPSTVPAAGRSAIVDGTSQQAPCWGSSYFAPTSATSNHTNWVSAQNLVAIQAYDNDFIFCAYEAQYAVPHVVEIKMSDSVDCADAANGYCTLELLDWGGGSTVCDPFTLTAPATGASCTANPIESYPHIWCDTYCQGCPSPPAAVDGECPMLSGESAPAFIVNGLGIPANFVNDGTTTARTTPAMPAYRFSCSSLSNARYLASACPSGTTPPLFCYYGTPSPSSTCSGLNVPAQPLDLIDQSGALSLSELQNVAVTFTDLTNANYHLAVTDGMPGVQVSNVVQMPNAG